MRELLLNYKGPFGAKISRSFYKTKELLMKNVNRISKILILTLLISASFAQPGRDLTGTEVSAVAFSAGGESHTTVEFNVSVVSPDFNFADGVRFTFDESVNILDAFMATELDMPAAVIISGNVCIGNNQIKTNRLNFF